VRAHPLKGEITLLIAKAEETEQPQQVSVAERVQQVMTSGEVDEKAALKKVAKELGLSRSEAYREWQRSRK
jgi:16S rRNA (cytidine1402-2'-O)-methyltransferase